MGLLRVACTIGLLAPVARSQGLQDCSLDASTFIVDTTDQATLLATALGFSDGGLSVCWVGEVIVADTIRVTDGKSLNITGAGPGAVADGQNVTQLFYVDGGSRLHLSGMALAHGSAAYGGAIFASRSDVSFSGNTSFVSNSASNGGGAIFAEASTVSWDGDGTKFSSNSAVESGGAIFAFNSSNVSWDGDDAHFSSNSAGEWGGAIFVDTSTMSWDGDGTQFSSNSAVFHGGAIYAQFGSTVSWDGDGARFNSNSAGSGGAILAFESTLSWQGDGTQFISNSAIDDGGAVSTWFSSVVSWNGTATFENNEAGVNGGGLHANGCDSTSDSGGEVGEAAGATFINNRANFGGALYLSTCENAFNFAQFVFEKNSALDGGAVAVYQSGSETFGLPVVFFECTFLDNVASGNGGAVETLAGQQQFISCDFEGNSAGEEKQTTLRPLLFYRWPQFLRTFGYFEAVNHFANFSLHWFSLGIRNTCPTLFSPHPNCFVCWQMSAEP